MTMNTSVSSNNRASALVSFLNARASRSFVTAEVDALFQDEPRVAEALDRVADLALRGHECVLGVDELETYERLRDDVDHDADTCRLASEAQIRDEADALVNEAKLLRQQISSMQRRLEILNKLEGGDDRSADGQVDQLTADIADVNDQVYQETLALVQTIGGFRASVSESPSSPWSFGHQKHVNELYAADNSLLDALDNITKVALAPNEDDALSADVELLSSQLADAQFRLFAAQVSHAYLTSLNQAPTPSRNRSGTNTVTEIKTLHAELDGLVSHYEEASRLLARQRIVDRMSDTSVRGRIEKMENELDAVQQIEDALEGMIGRMTLARDLTLFEMSKFDVLTQLVSKSRQQIIGQSQNKPQGERAQLKKPEIASDMATLQHLVGVRDSEEVCKLLDKANFLGRDMTEASLMAIETALQETKDIVTPLMSALYEDSATSEIKFVNPDVISQIRQLERHIEDVKCGINESGSTDAVQAQSQQFVKKWARHG